MKKVITLIFAMVIACAGRPQDKKANHPATLPESKWPDKGQLIDKLNLSAGQKVSIKSINEAFTKKLQELKSKSLNEEESRAKRRELSTARKEQFRAILTEAQRKQWSEMIGEVKQ